jgi:hypothetical protein
MKPKVDLELKIYKKLSSTKEKKKKDIILFEFSGNLDIKNQNSCVN